MSVAKQKNVTHELSLIVIEGYIHCRVPDKEWSFQDGGLYIIKKVGVKILTIIVLYLSVYELHV